MRVRDGNIVSSTLTVDIWSDTEGAALAMKELADLVQSIVAARARLSSKCTDQ